MLSPRSGGGFLPPISEKKQQSVPKILLSPRIDTRNNDNENRLKVISCSITLNVFVDPVITKDGITFERAAILESLKTMHLCPVTKNPINVSELVPNIALRLHIEFLKENGFLNNLGEFIKNDSAFYRVSSSVEVPIQQDVIPVLQKQTTIKSLESSNISFSPKVSPRFILPPLTSILG
jgi:hypothetical protein